jgi:hypothetical protein
LPLWFPQIDSMPTDSGVNSIVLPKGRFPYRGFSRHRLWLGEQLRCSKS